MSNSKIPLISTFLFTAAVSFGLGLFVAALMQPVAPRLLAAESEPAQGIAATTSHTVAEIADSRDQPDDLGKPMATFGDLVATMKTVETYGWASDGDGTETVLRHISGLRIRYRANDNGEVLQFSTDVLVDNQAQIDARDRVMLLAIGLLDPDHGLENLGRVEGFSRGGPDS